MKQKRILMNRRWLVIGVVLAVAILGSLIFYTTRAATPFLSVEPEAGTKTGTAIQIADSMASGGQAIKFNAASTPPPPPAASGTLFGASPYPGGESLASAQLVVTKYGGKPSVRQFNGSSLTWNATPAGIAVHRSWKPSASATDAQIDALLRAADADAAANGVKHILTFNHEPDNDGLDAAGRATMITKINRLYERKVALGLKNIYVSVIFTGGFFADYTAQANRDLWKGVKGDLVGLDADGVHTDQSKYPNTQVYVTEYDDEVVNVKKFMTDNKANGWTGWTVPEFGTVRSPYFDPSGSIRAAWMKKWGDHFAAQGAVHVQFYDYSMTNRDGLLRDYRPLPGTPEFNVWKSLIASN